MGHREVGTLAGGAKEREVKLKEGTKQEAPSLALTARNPKCQCPVCLCFRMKSKQTVGVAEDLPV